MNNGRDGEKLKRIFVVIKVKESGYFDGIEEERVWRLGSE